MKLTKQQITEAVRRYAQKHGYYVRTVRVVTSLRIAALQEWKKRAEFLDNSGILT